MENEIFHSTMHMVVEDIWNKGIKQVESGLF